MHDEGGTVVLITMRRPATLSANSCPPGLDERVKVGILLRRGENASRNAWAASSIGRAADS